MEGTGRGRGLAIFQALKKKQQEDSASSSSGSPSATTSATPSAAPSEVSSPIPPLLSAAIGGRGRALLLSRMQAQRPGGGQILTPASDSDPSPSASMRGVGRGLKILQTFEKAKVVASSSVSDVSSAHTDVEQLTEKMEGSTLSADTTTTSSSVKPKNKYFKEIKDSPPVVKKGEYGREVPITANYIRMSVEPGMGVFEYEVRYDPPIDYRGMCIQLLKEHLNVIGQTRIFDGTTLYVPKQLPDEVTVLKSNHPVNGTLVHIKVIFRRARKMGEVIHLYNVLFKNIMRELDLVRMNREHYDPRNAIQIPQHKLEVWPGYVTAVDEYEGGLMLTLDSKHRVLRTEMVLDFLQKTMATDRANFRQIVTERLIGNSVMTTYNKKLYRVDDIDLEKNPMSEFSTNDETMTFVDYYKKQYGIEIKDRRQPLLVSKQTKRLRDKDGEKKLEYVVCLIPELCVLTGLSEDMRKNFKLMKDVATYTRITPNQRYHAFKKFLDNVYNNENACQLLSKWGLKIAPDTINLIGRTLPPEPLTFGNSITTRGSPNADWSRDATNNPVFHAVDLLSWAILYTRKDSGCTQDFVDTLMRCGGPMGIRINKPQMILLHSDSAQQYVEQIKRACEGNIQLVVAICPTQRDDRYASIKRVCIIHEAIPSQVVVARTIMNRDKIRAIVQKIALQINCKLGGTLWTLHIPMKSVMVIGIDSYHEKGGKYKSVCGFVASYDETFTRWYSRVVLQNPREEIVEGLKSCLVDALHFFQQHRGFFPQKIIVYRDGVGDGQLKEVQNFEIKELKSLFPAVATDYSPTLTFVVVQKRINTRMFLRNGNNMDNPAPGTVLDYDITRRDWYDFLIVSQKVGQGTVTPSHYIVLEDTSNMKPDQVQRLTYKLCHLYYNWPGTVRVPAPCQYAHKLAYLVGEHMRQAHNIKLADKLFFL